MSTVESLIAAAQKHKGDWVALAAESGVSYSWMTKFAQGHIPDPRISTVKKLTTALAQREQKAAA